jgi:hypothetical protein
MVSGPPERLKMLLNSDPFGCTGDATMVAQIEKPYNKQLRESPTNPAVDKAGFNKAAPEHHSDLRWP